MSVPDAASDPFNSIRQDYKPRGAENFDLKQLRQEEFVAITRHSKNGFEFVCIYSNRYLNQVEAGINVVRTFFVLVVLALAAILFVRDANRLVLNPIERMLRKVKFIAENPLEAAEDNIDERAHGVLTEIHKKDLIGNQEEPEQKFETTVLEKTITKIGHLLALGFGEAGSGIIAHNMKAGGNLNPMMPGKRIFGIFGFCTIRDFASTTEVLQTQVLTFVN